MNDRVLKTDEQLVDECNKLARLFYKMSGCNVPDGYKFYQATHPAESGCWDMAVAAYEHIAHTDISEALSAMGE